MQLSEVLSFFEDFIGGKAKSWKTLAQSGSLGMNFIGTTDEKKYLVTFNQNVQENEAFFYYTDVFSQLKLNTPDIFKISEDRTTYIQSYVGSQTLFDIIHKEGASSRVKQLVKKSLEKLYHLQIKTQDKVDFKKAFEYEAYDEIPILHDLFYFKFMFADLVEVQYNKSTLIKEFKNLARKIECYEPKGLMIRDFQSRNIMVDDSDDVFFIDYQSAMNGPLMYDVVSLLFQAKADFTKAFRDDMLQHYYELWKNQEIVSSLKNMIPALQLMRFLQVLGAYGYRGLIQKKNHFLESIEKGIQNVQELSVNWETMEEYPELKKVIHQLASEQAKQRIQLWMAKND